MTKFVALLRGVNVGGKSKVSMKELSELFQTLGFTNVSTYINSGNIIFNSKNFDKTELTQIIQSALKKHFGFEIRCVIRTENEIKNVVQAIPTNWTNDSEQRTDILFLWEEFDSNTSIDLIKVNNDVDTLLYISGSIIWHVERKHISKSGMRNFIGTPVYKHMTARNCNTVRKLLKLME